MDIIQAGDLAQQWPVMAAGFVAAAVSGYACIHFLLNWLKQRNLYIFVGYVVLVSIISFFAIAWR